MKFKKHKLLFEMEVRFRIMKLFKKRVNKMVLEGESLSNDKLIKWHKRYEGQLNKLYEIKECFEASTNEKIVFFNMD